MFSKSAHQQREGHVSERRLLSSFNVAEQTFFDDLRSERISKRLETVPETRSSRTKDNRCSATNTLVSPHVGATSEIKLDKP